MPGGGPGGNLQPVAGKGGSICSGWDLRGQFCTAVTPLEEVFTYAMAFGQQYQCSYELVGERGLIMLDRAFIPPPDQEAKIMVRSSSESRELSVPPCDQFGG